MLVISIPSSFAIQKHSLRILDVVKYFVKINFITELNAILSARRNSFRGGSEVHQGRACKGGHRVGGSGGLRPPDAGEVFQKSFKKINEKLQFFKIFKKISRFFQIFLRILSNFCRKFGKNLENLEICICRGFGGLSPPTLANLLKSE